MPFQHDAGDKHHGNLCANPAVIDHNKGAIKHVDLAVSMNIIRRSFMAMGLSGRASSVYRLNQQQAAIGTLLRLRRDGAVRSASGSITVIGVLMTGSPKEPDPSCRATSASDAFFQDCANHWVSMQRTRLLVNVVAVLLPRIRHDRFAKGF